MSPRRAADKIVTVDRAAVLAASWRSRGERVVLANGVFDLLHVGHVRYLSGARRLGGHLVVGVNADASAAAAKGAGRPVLSERDRAALVGAVRGVELVVVFPEPTADRLIERIKPDVHAKGTDYRTDTVPERGTTAALGGETRIAGDAKAHSSRELVARVRERLGSG